jgi:transposase-like protein
MARPRQDTLRPRCPRPGHENSRVWLNGHRGPEGHRRPRWKCVPANGDKPHQFSETLPRQVTHDGFCDECERIYRRNEGPQGARYYLYSVREIAKALIDVGKGSSYRGAAFGVRRHAGRGHRPSSKSSSRQVRFSEHAQLVSDWVEVFAPVVYEPHRDYSWPATGSVVLDELPFRIQGGASTFSILAAMGWDEGHMKMRLWRLEAVPVRRNVTAAWCQFLRSLEGRPERVVCDRGNTLVKAIDEVWPESQRHHCEYHLKERCYSKLRDHGLCVEGTPPHDVVDRAFNSMQRFEEMEAAWADVKNPTVRKKLTGYLRVLKPIVRPQMEQRSSWPKPEHPWSTGALEDHLAWLRMHVGHRARQFTNKERMDRALTLMLLHRNKRDGERDYAEEIRSWLLAGEGHPRGGRRVITDVLGVPSLRP